MIYYFFIGAVIVFIIALILIGAIMDKEEID